MTEAQKYARNMFISAVVGLVATTIQFFTKSCPQIWMSAFVVWCASMVVYIVNLVKNRQAVARMGRSRW